MKKMNWRAYEIRNTQLRVRASEEKGRRTLRGGRSWKKQNLEGYVRNIGLHPEFSGTLLEGFKAGV